MTHFNVHPQVVNITGANNSNQITKEYYDF